MIVSLFKSLYSHALCYENDFVFSGQTTHTSSNGGSSVVKKVQKTTNYASVECGAKILSSNPEAKVFMTKPDQNFVLQILLQHPLLEYEATSC